MAKAAPAATRAPALMNNPFLRTQTEAQIRALISSGTPGGMPSFKLPDNELRALASWIHSLNMSAFDTKPAGNLAAAEARFFGEGQCAGCHMVQGRGKANGPDLSAIGRRSTVRELELVLDNPTSQMGIHTTASCPRWAFCPDDSWRVVNVKLRDGKSLRGFARGRAEHDLELQTLDGQLHFLTDKQYAEIVPEKSSIMPPFKGSAAERRDMVAYLASLGGGARAPVKSDEKISPAAMDVVLKPRPGEWPTYNGVLGGNRHSPLSQINTGNVDRLQMEWVYSLQQPNLETTPIVVDGVMYVTAADKVCALGAGTGRELWCFAYTEPTKDGRSRNPGSVNRGVAVLGDRVFFSTTDAHLICLNRLTGGLMWDVNIPKGAAGHFSASSAPMVVGDLVINGIGGGDSPLLGFLAAYKATTGEEAWRFHTVPPGWRAGRLAQPGKAPPSRSAVALPG